MGKKIAVALTVHNRHETAKICIDGWLRWMPKNAALFVVDDASDTPFAKADFRFERQAGIAKAKNKCLELAEDFDYIFCVDDDIHPVSSLWAGAYISSGLNHACYTFGRNILTQTDQYISYERPCGLMLFFKKICLEVAGGWHKDFGLWGHDHCQLSALIYNCGLTPVRFPDIPNSHGLFYSYDKENNIQSSLSNYERMRDLQHNAQVFRDNMDSTQFQPYK